MRRVVVTGLGALTPIGNTAQTYWDALYKGTSGAAKITRFDAEKFKTQFACELKDFDATAYMHRRDARRLDPFSQYAIVASDEAILDSGLDMEKIDLTRTGVIWGAGVGGFTTREAEILDFGNGSGTPRFNPFLIPKMIIDIVPGHISIKYGLRGINYATVSACASSSHAIINAFDYIRMGRADIMVAGGSEAAITATGIGGFNAVKALSERNDDPITASRPFDKDRDGFVLGEGAAALILEEYEHAIQRGAKIYAEIGGGGMNADAHHITAPHPDGIGAADVMRLALQDAKMTTTDIDYINVHGTSTPLGDVAEIKAIQKVFGEKAYELNISSTKSMTGHLLGAAGAIEALATILAIKNDIVPPTINHNTLDPEIDPKLNLTINKAQKRTINTALTNTFGFGGHNTSILIKKMSE